MAAFGLLINYQYCTGCRTCEVACQQAHGDEPGIAGIKLQTQGPTQLANGKWQYDFIPTPTAFCDHCGSRRAKGKQPSCVDHCQAGCMKFGRVTELAQEMTSKKMILFTRA